MVEPNEVWRQAILPSTVSLEQAIRNLNDVCVQIILVVDDHGKLIGTVSDGDIRRGLLKGLDLKSSIDDVTFRNSIVVPPGLDRDSILKLMVANKIHQIPVVDDNQHVVGLHLWDEINEPKPRENLMIIMAGGLGTRLRPHTETCPKPLLSVAGKPMLEHIIERARLEGFSNFVISIHYRGEMIEDYFGEGESLGVNIEYLREESPMGTCGALALLKPKPKEPFIVTNGDIITDINYSALLDFHRSHEAAATMAVRVHESEHPFGVVETDGVEIVELVEKPVTRCHINAGVYVLDPGVLDILDGHDQFVMPSLFCRLREQEHRTVAYAKHEPWLDVGRLEDLNRANVENRK